MSGRDSFLRIMRLLGATLGYGSFALFLALISVQVYRWLRDGEWTHIGMSEGMRIAFEHLGVQPGDSGRLAAFLHWLDAPADWVGLHTVLEVVPASLALFVASILGNGIFIYCRDLIDESARAARGS